MDIYPHVPYFYIIQHTPSQKLYAGARWGKAKTIFSTNGCNPIEFMVDGGYCTSSNSVKKLIEKDGIGSFTIKVMLTEAQCLMDVFSYETIFLQTFDIKSDSGYLNNHNNHSNRDDIIFDKYGVTNIMHLEEFVNKSKANNKITVNKKYGVDYIVQVPEIQLKKYGVTNIMHLQEFVDKAVANNKITVNKKYGVDCVIQVPEIKAKQQASNEATVIEKYNVKNVFQLSEIKEKSKKTLIAKTGYDNPNKTPENRLRITNQNNLLVTCEYCHALVKRACYFSNHGKYCNINPDKIVKNISSVFYHKDTLEKQTFTKGEDRNKSIWLNWNGKIYSVFNELGQLKDKVCNLQLFCKNNSISYTLLIESCTKNSIISQKAHKNSIDVSAYVGWYCRAESIKDLLRKNTLLK